MSRHGPTLPSSGPALGDVARLWAHLTTEYVHDAEIFLRPGQHSDGSPFVGMHVRSVRDVPGDDIPSVIIWASKSFDGINYKISINALYDLLIVAHRSMEAKFGPLERLPDVQAS